jgi:tripartite-type tricarboxylate transporter receptor subunit TctC
VLPGHAEPAVSWHSGFRRAIGLRKSTPGAIVERLNKEINAILAESQVQARLSDLGSAMFAGSSADFETFVVKETEKWSKVIRAANIKPE